jgi:hypothetical protein
MPTPALGLSLLLLAGTFAGPSSLATCWKGTTTNGSNPGLNMTLLCIAENGAVDLRVHFPNSPIGEPPTTCFARGRRQGGESKAFTIVVQDGRCENGSAMGGYEFQCEMAPRDTISCTHRNASGDLVHMALAKVFP